MALNGELYRQLNDALVAAFPQETDLDQMVRFGLNQNRAAIAGGSNLAQISFNLIGWAEAKGLTKELVIAARNSNPGNPELRRVAELLDVAPDSHELERIVTASVEFVDVAQWRAKMSQSELSVCRVEIPIGTGIGTGFLVGPGVALTNYHVMEDVINDWQDQGHASKTWQTVALRFDYKKTADGNNLQKGETFRLAGDWLIDSSPVGELDYALLRVEGDPGTKPVGNQADAPQRGWLTPKAHDFEKGEPLFIIQHPRAEPLKFTAGVIDDIQTLDKRVIYTANTLPGSSGSPCFTSNWELVALHHSGTGVGNRGITFSGILDQLSKKGLMDLISGSLPIQDKQTESKGTESKGMDDNQSSVVNIRRGFYQPGWSIQGDVNQAAGDIVVNNNPDSGANND